MSMPIAGGTRTCRRCLARGPHGDGERADRVRDRSDQMKAALRVDDASQTANPMAMATLMSSMPMPNRRLPNRWRWQMPMPRCARLSSSPVAGGSHERASSQITTVALEATVGEETIHFCDEEIAGDAIGVMRTGFCFACAVVRRGVSPSDDSRRQFCTIYPPIFKRSAV